MTRTALETRLIETLRDLLTPGLTSAASIEAARDLLAELGHDVRQRPGTEQGVPAPRMVPQPVQQQQAKAWKEGRRTTVHKVVLRVVFDQPCTKAHAAAAVRDCVYGDFYPTAGDAHDPERFAVRGVSPMKGDA